MGISRVSNFSQTHNLSHHATGQSLDQAVEAIKQSIRTLPELSSSEKQDRLQLLDELARFPIGQFLILNKGLNGKWTDYLVLYPLKDQLPCPYSYSFDEHDLEYQLLNLPTSLATQQRFQIFRQVLQSLIDDGKSYASVPCGLMSDLLLLDLEGASNIQFYGIDLDSDSTERALQYSKEIQVNAQVSVDNQDAWELKLEQPVDVITSNGLSIYEPSDQKVLELYQAFYENLLPGGTLVTSFLTLPPMFDGSEWDISKINPQAAQLQKLIFADILQAKWQSYRTTDQTKELLKQAGFKDIKIIPDQANIFPTAIAVKAS